MDANPYESPKADQPVTRARIVKRGVGLAVVLLLTPPAMIVAVFSTCKAQVHFQATSMWISFSVPLGVLVGLMALATIVRQPWKDTPGDARHAAGTFLFVTPILVALAAGLGLILGSLTYYATRGGEDALFGGWEFVVAFWAPPAITLLAMLMLIWRAR